MRIPVHLGGEGEGKGEGEGEGEGEGLGESVWAHGVQGMV